MNRLIPDDTATPPPRQDWPLPAVAPDPCNTGATKRQTEENKIETGGFDTLEISIYGRWNEQFDEMCGALDATRQLAESTDEEIPLRLGEHQVYVAPNGARHGGHFRWRLRWQGIDVHISQKQEAGENQANVWVCLGSVSCMALGGGGAWDAVCKFLQSLGYEQRLALPSRVDVCVDLPAVNINEFMEKCSRFAFVCRAKKGSLHFIGRDWNGLSIGKGVHLRIYDKLTEAAHDPTKLALLELKRWGGPVQAATRVEFQLRREKLRTQFDVSTVQDLFDKLRGIVDWLTGEWFRVTDDVPDRENHNTQRAKPAAIWGRVVEAFRSWVGETIIAPRKPPRLRPNPLALMQQMRGCAESVFATLGMIPGNVNEAFDMLQGVLDDLGGLSSARIEKKQALFQSRATVAPFAEFEAWA